MLIDFRARQYAATEEGYEKYRKEMCLTLDRIMGIANCKHVLAGFFENMKVDTDEKSWEPLDIDTFKKVDRRPIPDIAKEILKGIDDRIEFLRGYVRVRSEAREELSRASVERHILSLAVAAIDNNDTEKLAEFVEQYETLAPTTRNEGLVYATAWAVWNHYQEELKNS